MTVKFCKSVVTTLVLLFSVAVMAQEPEPSRMPYELAMIAAEAAESHARLQGWNVTILVTDQNGDPVILRRLDGASARTATIAISKTLVVVKTGFSSGEYGAKLRAGEIEEIEGGVSFQGGVPIYLDGELIGAIAASGVSGAQDEEVAIAGAETVGSLSQD